MKNIDKSKPVMLTGQ